MSVRVDLSDCQRLLVRRLKNLLVDPSPADREAVASYGIKLVLEFVPSVLLVKRYGFDLPISEVANSAADEVCASVLQMRRGPEGREETALLARNLYRRLLDKPDIVGKPDEDRSWVARVPDGVLFLAFRRLLFDRAEKQIVHIWKMTHGPGHRILKSFKRHIFRSERFQILRRPHGQFVLGPRSDPSLPPMTRIDVEECLPASVLGSTGRTLDALAGALAPAGSHGGYCFLMDLVLAVQIKALVLLAHDPCATGAAPALPEDVSMKLFLERARVGLEKAARRLLAADCAKHDRRRPDPSSADDADASGVWVAVAVEMVMRRFDAGRPEWDGLSQRALIEHLLPCTGRPEAVRFHDRTVTYLVRRLRRRLKEAVLERA
jgi:hypothetical protein